MHDMVDNARAIVGNEVQRIGRFGSSCAVATLVLAGIVMPHDCMADDISGKLRISVGYVYLGLSEKYAHNTHPSDSFLPNASVPGSAGTTSLNSGNFAKIGVGYEAMIAPSTLFTVDIGGLVGVNNRDDHQNANDSRPAANGAFIYSEGQWGLFVEPSVLYQFNWFWIGVSAQLAGVYVDNGWDRFSSDQSASASLRFYPSVGPKVRADISENLALEGTVQYGRKVAASISLVAKF